MEKLLHGGQMQCVSIRKSKWVRIQNVILYKIRLYENNAQNNSRKEDFEMKLKKMLSMLTACCMAVSTATVGLSLDSTAAETITFTVDNVVGKPGDTVALTVKVDNLNGEYAEAVNGGKLNITEYQTQSYKLASSVTAEAGDAFKGAVANGENIDTTTYKWLFAANDELFTSTTADETILTFNLTIADERWITKAAQAYNIKGVAEGDNIAYEFPISVIDAYAASEVDVEFNVKTVDGSVKVMLPKKNEDTTTSTSTTSSTTTTTSTGTSDSTTSSTTKDTTSSSETTTTSTVSTTSNSNPGTTVIVPSSYRWEAGEYWINAGEESLAITPKVYNDPGDIRALKLSLIHI